MPCRPFLRRLLTLLLAVGIASPGFDVMPAVAAPASPVPAPPAAMADCPHHNGQMAEHGVDHGNDGHDHGDKQGACHCPQMTCSGWTLAPVTFDLVDFYRAPAPHRIGAAIAFVPHPPGVPLQPPRA